MSQGCGNWDELRQVQPSGVRSHTAYEDEEALRSSSLARRRTASMMRSPWFQSTPQPSWPFDSRLTTVIARANVLVTTPIASAAGSRPPSGVVSGLCKGVETDHEPLHRRFQPLLPCRPRYSVQVAEPSHSRRDSLPPGHHPQDLLLHRAPRCAPRRSQSASASAGVPEGAGDPARLPCLLRHLQVGDKTPSPG